MSSLPLVFVAAALIWWCSLEYFRGRPSTTANVSWILKWVIPIGVLCLSGAGLIALWMAQRRG
jgi:hypothetical protein